MAEGVEERDRRHREPPHDAVRDHHGAPVEAIQERPHQQAADEDGSRGRQQEQADGARRVGGLVHQPRQGHPGHGVAQDREGEAEPEDPERPILENVSIRPEER